MSNAQAADALRDRRIFAASGVATETRAIQTVLAAAGATVELFDDGNALLRRAAEAGPDIVLLDTALPRADVAQMTRVLARHPKTVTSAILLVLPADANPRLARMYAGLGPFGMLARPLTCAAIREQFASAARFVDASREAMQQSLGVGESAIVPGCDALLRRNLTCPFHSFGVKVPYYQLRAGKLAAETDVFDVPAYKQATRDGDAIDYNLVAVAVCPECFFATADTELLDDTADFDARTMAKIAQGSGLRGLSLHDELGRDADAAFFTHERTPEGALAAYLCAAQSSVALYEAAPVRRAIELLRAANHRLRRAAILEQHLARPADALAERREAATWARRAFAEVKGAPMYKAAYQAMAVLVHLGEDADAVAYLTALRDEKKLAHRDQQDPATLDRYLRRCTHLWEDRERYRAPAPARRAA